MQSKAIAVILRILAGVLTLVGLAWNFIGMAIVFSGGRWEEGEALGPLDWLIVGFLPLLAIVGLVLAYWKPLPGGLSALAISPLLLLEAPIMYGRPSPISAAIIGGAAALHLLAWAIRRPKQPA